MTACAQDDALLESALRQARDTRRLVIGRGARRDVAAVFGELFGDAPCAIIADENTFAAAGSAVLMPCGKPGAPYRSRLF
jgi:hypothetical protein